MDFNELSRSVRAALFNRLKSPFYGTFIISWMIWNWRIIFLIFASDKSIGLRERICLIQGYSGWLFTLFGPLFSSVIVFVCGTLLTMGFRYLQINFSNWRKNKIEKLEMLSVEDTIKAKSELVEYENRINTTSVDLKRQIEGLEQIIKDKDEQIERLNQDIDGVVARNNELLNSQVKLVKTNSQKSYEELLDKPIISNNLKGLYETVESKVLKSKEGGLFVWALVTDEHNNNNDGSYRYIIAHATNNGESIEASRAVYANAWSISRFAKGRNKQGGEWRFWCTNENGEGGIESFLVKNN